MDIERASRANRLERKFSKIFTRNDRPSSAVGTGWVELASIHIFPAVNSTHIYGDLRYFSFSVANDFKLPESESYGSFFADGMFENLKKDSDAASIGTTDLSDYAETSRSLKELELKIFSSLDHVHKNDDKEVQELMMMTHEGIMIQLI